MGALIAGDAVDPEDVAAGVDLDVEAFGRRPEPDLRVVEAARARTGPIIHHNRIQIKHPPGNPSKINKPASAGTYVPSVGGEAEAAKREVSGREEAAVAGAVVGAKGADVGASSTASYSHGELAAHLEDAGCRGAGSGPSHQQQQRGEEERSTPRRRRRRSHGLFVGGADGDPNRPARSNGREAGYDSCPPPPPLAVAPPPPRGLGASACEAFERGRRDKQGTAKRGRKRGRGGQLVGDGQIAARSNWEGNREKKEPSN